MEQGERDNVFKVYDKIAAWFFRNRGTQLHEKQHLDAAIAHLPASATVLDLGCGTGKPIMEYLINNQLNVTGVDASHAMLDIAKLNFPSVDFVLKDMRQLNLNRKFDAVIAWHSFFHLPTADQPAMFQRFADHLNPNGILVFTSGTDNGEAWGMNGGEKLFHASLSSSEYENLLYKHHFEILNHTINDLDCGGDTVWMAKYVPE